MKFKNIEKVSEGKFLSFYNVNYETANGIEKTYEMVSRNHQLKEFHELHDKTPDAVVMIMHDESNEKILLSKEYRMAAGDWVYNFPAGLVESGESLEEAARRELKEETGLDIIKIEDTLKESYSAVGLSNEKTVCILGIAEGSFQKSSSPMEEIKAGWFTKQEVKNLLKNEKFAARTQIYLYMWSRS